MPAKESIVLRLNFCVWTDAANPWIDGQLWRDCERHFDLGEMEGRPCWGALDLSGKNDLCALSLVWRHGEKWRAATWFWTPGETLDERSRRDGVPYQSWVNDGFLEAPDARAIKYEFVAVRLGELAARFDIQAVSYDPYHIAFLEHALVDQGVEVPLTPHAQGYAKSSGSGLLMPRSVEVLEQAVQDGSLEILPNPVLAWNSASAILEMDAKGNRIFTKRKSTGRIDGVVSLAMAMGTATHEEGGDLDEWMRTMTEAA